MKKLSVALFAAIVLALAGCQQPEVAEVEVQNEAVGGAPAPAVGAAAGGAAPMVGTESLQGGTGGGPAQAAIERARGVGADLGRKAPEAAEDPQPVASPVDGAGYR